MLLQRQEQRSPWSSLLQAVEGRAKGEQGEGNRVPPFPATAASTTAYEYPTSSIHRATDPAFLFIFALPALEMILGFL